MEKGHAIGLVSDERLAKMEAKKQAVADEIKRLESIRIKPKSAADDFIQEHGDNPLKDSLTAAAFLRRPYVTYQKLLEFIPAPEKPLNRQEAEQVEIQLKYAGYIKKEEVKVERLKRMEAKKIPADIDYEAIEGLATEGRQKMEKIRPETLAQASRISGVNPADLAILSVYIQQGRIAKIHSNPDAEK